MDQARKFESAINAIAKIFTTDHKIFQVYIQSSETIEFKFVTENKTFVINFSLKYKPFFVESCWSTNHDELQSLIETLRLTDNFMDQVISVFYLHESYLHYSTSYLLIRSNTYWRSCAKHILS